MDKQQRLDLYRIMFMAREIDRIEQQLTNRGEAFFHVSGAGHEGSAVLNLHLIHDDWLHCHYRDKALMLARGLAPHHFFDSLYCKANSHSHGRQMSAHMSERRLNLMSIVGPVGNSALQAVGVAKTIKNQPSRPVVLCSVGDGTTQEGEFLEAVGEVGRWQLPVLFLVEDNRWAISTSTRGKTFYDLPTGQPDEFFGLEIHRIDGRDAVQAEQKLAPVVRQMRASRQGAIVVLEVERLSNHTNADDQRIYRNEEEIRNCLETADPIVNLEKTLLADGVSIETLQQIQQSVIDEVELAETRSAAGPEPEPTDNAKEKIPTELTHPSTEIRGTGDETLTMKDAIRDVLKHHMSRDERFCLYGEDIEDPKGDVFGVTKGLSTQFGDRVCNSPLSESTIVGVSVGRALAGERPIAFIQFADFLPLAYNQIVSELGSMYWRTAGQWRAPVVIMVPCGGYRPGLGPFHAQSFESMMVHTPGLDVFMPSTACDAAGLLNAAIQSERPSIYFYPKSCLNDPATATSADVHQQHVPIGPARKVRSGRDLTLVGWGNTVKLCEKTAEALEQVGVETEILDLRTLSPWDQQSVLASAEKTARLIVVHEDNHTCGLGGEILATVTEHARVPIAMRRVTRPDTYVPCNFANQIEILPSWKRLLTTAAELLDVDLSWIEPTKTPPGIALVEAIGSGPSDETVQVVEFAVAAGETLERGQVVASLEATKSVFELTSPVSGQVVEILASAGETVEVGAPILKVATGAEQSRPKPITQEQPGTPILQRRRSSGRLQVADRSLETRRFEVGISSVETVEGGQLITNEQLIQNARHRFSQNGEPLDWSAEDICKLTGIRQRRWANQDENAVSMAVQAGWKVLDREGLLPDDLNLAICCTSSPTSVSPSMACQIMKGISGNKTKTMVQAYDINAACSGYLYALQAGYDFLQSQPSGRVMILTTEVLSPLLNLHDLDTTIIFADAASATILYGEDHLEHAKGRIVRPDLSAKSDDDDALSVPLLHDGYIQMKGRKVFTEAVRSMIASLNRVCHREGLQVDDLSLVVPHQANQRILDAIQSRVRPTVFSNISEHGNTSSTSIPLCLSELIPDRQKGDQVGLCAFGGGFTFGAGILQWN